MWQAAAMKAAAAATEEPAVRVATAAENRLSPPAFSRASYSLGWPENGLQPDDEDSDADRYA